MAALLRASYSGELPSSEVFEGMSDKEWDAMSTLCLHQGLHQLLYKQIERLPKPLMPSRLLLFKWIANAEEKIKRCKAQKVVCEALAKIWSEQGIRVVVLKGMAFAQYYPSEDLRSFGDFDCYLGEDYARGNELAAAAGAHVDASHYKHSHITFRGILCENHQLLLPTRMGARVKRLNAHMTGLLTEERLHPLSEGSAILAPCVEFDLKYQLYHIYRHFMDEDIALRDIYDWAVILREAVRQGLDMQEFAAFCKEYVLEDFVAVVNDLAVRFVGASIPAELPVSGKYSERVLHEMFAEENKIYSKETRTWMRRILYIRNMFRGAWKHHHIAHDTVVGYLARTVVGFLFKTE